MRDQDHQRRDVESSEQRENRLQHMRDQEHQRRDVESSEQRENRLQHMRDQEHERRDAEDLAQRDSRLQRLRESRQRQPDHPQIALFDQPAVRAKMLNFHMSISTIEVPLSHYHHHYTIAISTILNYNHHSYCYPFYYSNQLSDFVIFTVTCTYSSLRLAPHCLYNHLVYQDPSS